jgi:hypothetical protein
VDVKKMDLNDYRLLETLMMEYVEEEKERLQALAEEENRPAPELKPEGYRRLQNEVLKRSPFR